MFLDYDIVLFDFRGHGYKEFKFLDPSTWLESPTKMLFSVDLNEVRMGAEEEKDIFAVVDEFRKNKNYEQVVGLGVCYSALIFVKAAAIRQKESKEKLFDKLILDGCWLSLQDYVDKLAQDPKRIFSPQNGGWKDRWPIKELWFQKALCYLGQKLFYTKFNDVSILDYLPELRDIPILYFYGKDDMVVIRQEFEIIWNATRTGEKTVILTSNPHVRNHLKQKEFYKLACDLFLKFPQKEFVQYLKDKNKLMQYHMSQQQNLWKTEATG
jgi:pimeloyl-ACP methyl ester carboxylesterase